MLRLHGSKPRHHESVRTPVLGSILGLGVEGLGILVTPTPVLGPDDYPMMVIGS